MNPTPYLSFQGTCREAMTFYAEVFGGEIEMMMTAAEMPDFPVPDDKKDWIAHCGLKLSNGELLASDDLMGGTGPMDGCSVMMSFGARPEAVAAFDKLAEGGTVRMAFAKTFWSPGFGTLTDRFGTHWMIDTADPA
ncbi:MAG: VOC family protein [Pseudomonadota bacterium]